MYSLPCIYLSLTIVIRPNLSHYVVHVFAVAIDLIVHHIGDILRVVDL